MPFEKGNNLWKKGLEARKQKDDMLTEFFEIVVTGGIEVYAQKLAHLSEGKELTKEELDFMDRVEKLFEYVRPKLGRTEVTGKDGKDFKGVQIYLPKKNGLETAPEAGDSLTQ
jgi:hypothetical protein